MQGTIVVNDSNWFSHMVCVFIWMAYWLIFYIGGAIGITGYYALANLLFFVSAILILLSIFMKNGVMYKVGFFIYVAHFIISILTVIGIIVLIFFFMDLYIKMIGFSFAIAGQAAGTNEGIDLANDVVKTTLLIFKIIVCIALAIDIITEIIFLCYLRTRFAIFDAYQLYALGQSPEKIQPLQQF